ncbi:MAG TPA: CAP domain-containing protein [Candidatus Paceibacterota bacterium]|nr:CAP domain-containing protein [Candidatus Paceibacterota bacterium]HRY76976.1 CAP domain-containing protein [Candidatus Paceibacterota bacterium]
MKVKKSLKKYFIPHQENDHQPHILRSKAVNVIAAVIIFCELVFLFEIYGIFPKNFMALILPDVLIDETNVSRSTNNLNTLKTSLVLNTAAQLKADDMAAKGYFSHTSPEGLTPWHWFELAGYRFSYAGENLAVNFVDSKDVVDAWMNSPGHRANILSDYFTEIGIGVADGKYNGQEATFIVQMFGRPAAAVQTPPQPKTPQTTPVAVKPTPVPLESSDTFVAVKGAEVEPGTSVTPIATPIGDEQTEPRAASLEKIISQPKTTAVFIYVALGLVVLVALLLTIFIKIKIQYPRLIKNGVLLLILIGVILAINQFITLYHSQII